MIILHRRTAYFLVFIIGMMFLFGDCHIAWAEKSSPNLPVITKDQKKKVVNKGTSKTGRTIYKKDGETVANQKDKYNIKIVPIPNTRATNKAKPTRRSEKDTESTASFKYEINVMPFTDANGQALKTNKARRHGEKDARSEASLKYEIKELSPVGHATDKAKLRKHGEKEEDSGVALKYEDKTVSSLSGIDKISIETRAWKIDASGNRTNEEIIDGLKWIKKVDQSPETKKN